MAKSTTGALMSSKWVQKGQGWTFKPPRHWTVLAIMSNVKTSFFFQSLLLILQLLACFPFFPSTKAAVLYCYYCKHTEIKLRLESLKFLRLWIKKVKINVRENNSDKEIGKKFECKKKKVGINVKEKKINVKTVWKGHNQCWRESKWKYSEKSFNKRKSDLQSQEKVRKRHQKSFKK